MKNTKEIENIKKEVKKQSSDIVFYLFVFLITYISFFIFTGSISFKENIFTLKTNIPGLNIFLIHYIFIGFILSLKKEDLKFTELKNNILLNLGIAAAFYLVISIIFPLINKSLASSNVFLEYYLVQERIKLNSLAYISGIFIFNVFNYINIKKYVLINENKNKNRINRKEDKSKSKNKNNKKTNNIYLRYIAVIFIYTLGMLFNITNIIYSVVSILMIVLVIKDIKKYLTKANILKETKNIIKLKIKDRIRIKNIEKNVIIYPYILEVVSALILFIYLFLNKSKDFPRKAIVFIISFSIIMLIKHLIYFVSNKIYQDIKLKKRSKEDIRFQIIYTLILGIIFVSFIYLKPYKIVKLFTNNLSIQNEVINNIKFLNMSIIINMLNIFLIYKLFGLGNIKTKDKNAEEKKSKIKKLLNVILITESVLPYILIYISFKISAYKCYLYSFFITDMIIFILIGIIYLRKRKNWVILEKY